MQEDTLTGNYFRIEDPRTPKQKALDYTHHDILAGGVNPLWETKTSWRVIDRRYQALSSSCGGQAPAKAITSFVKEIMSASPLYRDRSNFPAAGMYEQDIGDIAKNKKTCTEAACASQGMSDAQMNVVAIPELRQYGISAYYALPVQADLNMDLLAQALAAGHALIFGLVSNVDEWTNVPAVGTEATTFSHFVCAIPDNSLLYNNEKAVVIDDSCNAYSTIGGDGQRILTESFIKARVWGILALIPLSVVSPSTKPTHSFTKPLSFGMTDPDVSALQDILKFEGVFPTEIQSTGYFGTVTQASVIKLQNKYASAILTPQGLTEGTGNVGTGTIAWLNANYN